jgi:hypothetical protein
MTETKAEDEKRLANRKSKRSNERMIGNIIEKVYIWRKLYNGYKDENGRLIKCTLEKGAELLGISKKSLDDYLIQLRIGRKYGFPFNDNLKSKVGTLRSFVRVCKEKEMNNQ